MIFLDSWIWLEFFQEDEKSEKAEEIIQKIEHEETLISSTVLTEVRYQLLGKYGESEADRLVNVITSFENLKVMPVTDEVALYAADLRHRYYDRSQRTLSYADSIHLATAIMTDCGTLYTGDPDFEGISDIETIVV